MLSSKLVEMVKIFRSECDHNDNKTFKLFHSIDFVTDLLKVNLRKK